MKYYSQLLDMQTFSREDVILLTGNENTANSIIFDYKRKDYVRSVRRNLYVAISMETRQPVASRFRIASSIMNDSFISHHSAFEYYGVANQVYYDVYVSGDNRFASFDFDNVTYKFQASRIDPGVEKRADGVSVTDMERTILDGINDFERIGGLEELIRCVELVPYADEGKLLSYLELYNKRFLYQKTGYILEHFKKSLRLADQFFDICKSKCAQSVRYFYKDIKGEPSIFNDRWQLIVPEDLLQIVSNGGQELA